LASQISDKIEYAEAKLGELKYSCADMTKTYNTFDWNAEKTIKTFL
jgi:hypothetical protein